MIRTLGRNAIRIGADTAYAAGFFMELLRESLFFFRTRRAGFKVLVMQVLFTAVEALGIISVIALAIGIVIIVQGLALLPQFGQQKLLYTILIVVITRQLGPILTAFIVTARSSTAIATELGNMVVSHEIEAYVSIGVNPVAFLAVPRFLGVTISVMFLNIYFNFLGLGGAYLFAYLVNPIPFSEYFRNLLAVLSPTDLVSSLIKSIVFGVIISTVAVYYGFKVQRSSTEIPQMAIKAVGRGFVCCIVADAVITLLYYL